MYECLKEIEDSESQIQRIAIALCLSTSKSTRKWAVLWLSGKNRSQEAAEAAWEAAKEALTLTPYFNPSLEYHVKVWKAIHEWSIATLSRDHELVATKASHDALYAALLVTFNDGDSWPSRCSRRANWILQGHVPAEEYDV